MTKNPASSALEQALGYTFQDPTLLQKALTHPSFLKTKRSSFFERAEFLGDRVLGLTICDFLFRHFPQEAEGAMAKRFAYLVRKETLAQIALSIHLGDHLVLSSGESKGGARSNTSILGDSLEALLGAIYLDAGFLRVQSIILELWDSVFAGLGDVSYTDAKSALQEWIQQKGLPLPVYTIIDVVGPDHAPTFHVEVTCESLSSVVGEGSSKKNAEQAAAQILLNIIRNTS